MPGVNLVESPLLVHLILAQLKNGATGATKEQINRAIHYLDSESLSTLVDNIKQTKYRSELTLAAAIFPSKEIA